MISKVALLLIVFLCSGAYTGERLCQSLIILYESSPAGQLFISIHNVFVAGVPTIDIKPYCLKQHIGLRLALNVQ